MNNDDTMDILEEQLNILENTKVGMRDILEDKGQNIPINTPFSNYVDNMANLGTVHLFNTKAEMDTTTNLPRGTIGLIYSPYIYTTDSNEFVSILYLPKQLSYTYNEIDNLGNNYILGELEIDSSTLYGRAIVNNDGEETKIVVTISGNNYIYRYTNNVWTRIDDIKVYREIELEEPVNYRTYTQYAGQIFQIQDDNSLMGVYKYRDGWNLVNTQFTASANTVLNGYVAYTNEGVVKGVGPVDVNAVAGDIWQNTAYINGGKVTGTLQVTQNVNRQELDTKINMWNTFTNFSTTSNDLSYLMQNLPQKLIPKIYANDIVNMARYV